MKEYNFWFVVGSQFLYGEETLRQVERNCIEIVKGLNASSQIPYPILYKVIVVTDESALAVVKEANYDDTCAGIITFCHTFSPSKMWIRGLSLLQKPWCHLHTQFNREIPNEAIDMDYMNLYQSAHGDREHGYIGARMSMRRKVIAGFWGDESVAIRIGKWQKAAVGAMVSQSLNVMRFGDNMRDVAVTEGDKVETQIKLGWSVNTYPVGLLVETMDRVTDQQIEEQIDEYRRKYTIATDAMDTVRYQAREEIAMKTLFEMCNCSAFSNTFEDLFGMRQLPGLATQDLMSLGYGYAGEGDWKTAAMTAIMKAMGDQTSFMEDYTYDLKSGLTLGAHMLEVCPSIAVDKPRIEVHALGIGDRQPPARLVFEGVAGAAIVASLVDMGTHLRLIVQDVECVEPVLTMPNLPVARVMWKPMPDLETGAECWILAGGAHHTTLSYGVDAEIMRDWARIVGIEFIHINKYTKVDAFERELEILSCLRR